MNDEQFYTLLAKIGEYLHTEKQFVDNPFRQREVQNAIHKANELFPDAKIELRSDPLQLGALILHMEMFDINVSGETEINLFKDIIADADNFEIYSMGEDLICLAAVFQNAFIKI